VAAPLSVLEQAQQLDAERVGDCLEPCAAATVAWLLSAAQWPWSAAVLERMPPSRRVAVLEYLDRDWSAVMPPAVLHAVCEGLCEQAARLAVERAAGAMRRDDVLSRTAESLCRRVLRRLVAWKR
jgi:hypothetical protein